MSSFDHLERQLLASVGQRLAGQPAHPVQRVGPRVGGLLPRTLDQRSRRWALTVAAAAAVAVTLLVVGTTGSGPSSAFAGWSASPTPPAKGQLQTATAGCEQQGEPTLADVRGPWSLEIWARSDGAAWFCIYGPQYSVVRKSWIAGPISAPSTPVAPNSIAVTGSGAAPGFAWIIGPTGANVTGVTLLLDDGTQVQATSENGLFAAWWPGTATARSAEPTTASGTTTQPLSTGSVVLTPSASGTGSTGTSSSGVSGTSGSTAGSPPPTPTSTLASGFAVLRQPEQSEPSLPSGIAGAFTGPAQPPNPYGLDPNLARYAAAANTWVLPGTSGVCLITIGVVGPGVGSQGCGSTTTALSGDLVVFSRKGPTHETSLVGLAPDDNTTVSVTATDGSTRQVPVTDNVYVVTGGSPSSITLRSANGSPTTLGVP
jgi:hypothetical protein